MEQNPDIIDNLKKIYPDKIKDNWDCIVELYRYNIKLSRSIYPYLAILENIVKIHISNYLKNKYGEDFYYNEELFFKKLKFDEFDIKIFRKYFNHKINKYVREELIEIYKKHNPELKKEKIKNKITKIKRAVSILSDAREYRFKNTKCNLQSFVESKPTLNYWITLLEIKSLYSKNNETDCDLEFDSIFPNAAKQDVRTLKTISQKLNDIRILRNNISHYNKIIYTDISKNLTLWDIYKSITELFALLGCSDVRYIIGDIACCEKSDFENLYHKFDFLHNTYMSKKT